MAARKQGLRSDEEIQRFLDEIDSDFSDSSSSDESEFDDKYIKFLLNYFLKRGEGKCHCLSANLK